MFSHRISCLLFVFVLSAQNELKGEMGLKGEKGEQSGGYYDPRYGGSGVGTPGVPGPPVRSHHENRPQFSV